MGRTRVEKDTPLCRDRYVAMYDNPITGKPYFKIVWLEFPEWLIPPPYIELADQDWFPVQLVRFSRATTQDEIGRLYNLSQQVVSRYMQNPVPAMEDLKPYYRKRNGVRQEKEIMIFKVPKQRSRDIQKLRFTHTDGTQYDLSYAENDPVVILEQLDVANGTYFFGTNELSEFMYSIIQAARKLDG